MSQTVKHQIKHRFTDAVLFECDVPADIESGFRTRYVLEKATQARANLAGAYLARANLAGAYLARAYLARAYLADADLAGADLAGAYLAGAYLAGAYLADANLAGANLARANLAGADLARANLARADLARADLARAKWAEGVFISKTPIQIHGLRWSVAILDSHMQIGCQLHALHTWESFTDDQISAMDSDALDFWSAHKAFLLGMARANGRSFEPVEQKVAA